MTFEQRIELETYVDILNSIIADFYRVALKQNLPLDKNNDLSNYYKILVQTEHKLRRTSEYKEVLKAKNIIIDAQAKLAKWEVLYDI